MKKFIIPAAVLAAMGSVAAVVAVIRKKSAGANA